jgi:hypothetical protein
VDIGKRVTIKWGDLWGRRTRREGNQDTEHRQVGHGREVKKGKYGNKDKKGRDPSR